MAYGELTARARLASYLMEFGIEPNDRVATLSGRRPDRPVALIGAIRVGAIVVPLDPKLGPQEIVTVTMVPTPTSQDRRCQISRERLAGVMKGSVGRPAAHDERRDDPHQDESQEVVQYPRPQKESQDRCDGQIRHSIRLAHGAPRTV